MTVHIGCVELYTAVTADGKISDKTREVKMVVHIGFVKLCTAITADGDISSHAKEVKMTVHIGFVFKYTTLSIQGIYCRWQLLQVRRQKRKLRAFVKFVI